MLSKLTGRVFRTVFWLLILIMTSHYALVPALVVEFPEISFLRSAEFLAILYLLSLAISIRLFLFPTKRDDYNGEF